MFRTETGTFRVTQSQRSVRFQGWLSVVAALLWATAALLGDELVVRLLQGAVAVLFIFTTARAALVLRSGKTRVLATFDSRCVSARNGLFISWQNLERLRIRGPLLPRLLFLPRSGDLLVFVPVDLEAALASLPAWLRRFRRVGARRLGSPLFLSRHLVAESFDEIVTAVEIHVDIPVEWTVDR